MFWSSKKEPKEALELIVDIRSSSIGAAIVDVGTTPATVRYSARVPIAPDKLTDATIAVETLFETLKRVFESVVHEGVPLLAEADGDTVKIEHITATFGSPWFHAKTRDLEFKKEAPFKLSKKQFDEMVEKQIALEKERAQGQVLVEHDVTNVVINGYELQDPFDKEAKQINVSFYASLMAASTRKKLDELFDTYFHKVDVTYRTFPLMLFTTLRNMFWNIDRFTFLDIGGAITDIGVVQNGALTHLASVPYGANHLLQSVGAECALEPATTASTLAMIARGETDASCNEKAVTALQKAEKKWLQELAKVVDEDGVTLPGRVFVTCDQSVAPVFKATLATEDAKKNVFATDQDLQVTVLDAVHFKKHVTIPQEQSLDTFTVLGATFLKSTE